MLSCFGRLSSGWQLRPVYYFAVQIPNLILYLSIWNPDPNSKCRTLNRYIDFKLCLLWFPFQNPVLHQISLIQWSPKIINHSWCYVSIQNVFFSEWYLGQYVTAVWEMHQLSVFDRERTLARSYKFENSWGDLCSSTSRKASSTSRKASYFIFSMNYFIFSIKYFIEFMKFLRSESLEKFWKVSKSIIKSPKMSNSRSCT